MITPFEQMIQAGNWLILDTETTGLRAPAEIVQIAIIDPTGQVLLDTLIKPSRPIPADAIRIHGITNELVVGAPAWWLIADRVAGLIRGKNVITYNATYDRYMFHCSDDMCGLPKREWKNLAAWHCAMLWYAERYGEWDDYHGNYKWQKLTNAMGYEGLPISNAHSALGDCQMTLSLINRLLRTP